MEPWLPAATFALVVWAIQRAISKAALFKFSSAQFYWASAAAGFPIYLGYALWNPPAVDALPGAVGVAVLQAFTFWVTIEALRRGRVGRVSPITGLSPAVTAVLAMAVLGEISRPRAPLVSQWG